MLLLLLLLSTAGGSLQGRHGAVQLEPQADDSSARCGCGQRVVCCCVVLGSWECKCGVVNASECEWPGKWRAAAKECVAAGVARDNA
jgi:hypothetical protein